MGENVNNCPDIYIPFSPHPSPAKENILEDWKLATIYQIPKYLDVEMLKAA